MRNGILTRRELVEICDQLCAESPYFETQFLTEKDFAPFFQTKRVWCWESAEIAVADASVWIEQRLDELPQKKCKSRCGLLCLWASTAHNLENLERVIGTLSWKVDRMLFDILLREDLEETKLGLLLLSYVEPQADQKVRHSS